MKFKHVVATLTVCFLALVTPVAADTFTYPKNNPIVSITFPEGWSVEPDGDALHSGPADGSLYFGFLPLPEDADSSTAGEFIGAIVGKMVKDYKAGEEAEFTNNGIYFAGSDGTGTQRETGEDMKVSTLFFVPDVESERLFAIIYFGTEEAEAKYEDALTKIVASIKNPRN